MSGSGGGSLTFSESVTSKQLIEWLHQEVEEKFKEKIKALSDIFENNDVDGEMFLELTEDALAKEPFKVESWGLRKKIVGLVEKQKNMESPKAKVELVPVITNWCSYKNKTEEPLQPAKPGARPAVMPRNAHLWDHEPLLIKFKSPYLLETWDIDAEQILHWARKWRHEKSNHIPSFELAKENDKPDIVIELNSGGNSSSLCGKTNADTTMWLDLSQGDHRYKEHIVVHEFGHALGLGHEHQRSDFCKCVDPYLDKSKMKKDLGARFSDWEKDFNLDDREGEATAYDSHSVMHYWFKTEWLTHGCDKKENIEKNSVLSEKQKTALIGIHRRAGKVPIVPSKKDLDFLNKKYGGGVVADFDEPEDTPSNGQGTLPAATQASLPAAPTTTTTAAETVNFSGLLEVSNTLLDQIKWKNLASGEEGEVFIYRDAAGEWRRIAGQLGLGDGEINGIHTEKLANQEQCVIAVFSKWLQNASGMKNAKIFPKSWKGLITLLNKSKLTILAEKVQKAILAPQSEAKGNLPKDA